MPGPTTISRGNVTGTWVLSVTLSPASVAPNTSAEQTFSVTGIQLGDMITVNKPTSQAGLTVGGGRASAINQIGISFGNLTAATITPTASQVYYVKVVRPENLDGNSNSTMTQIV